jgi:plastocyanin
LPRVLIAATDINAFHVVGALLAIWAVLVAALGIMRHDFPGSDVAEKAVIAISAILVVGTIASGLITSANAAEEHGGSGEVATEHNKAGEEGTEGTTGTPAPDTAPESDQEGADETGQDAPPGETVQTLELSAGPDTELAFDPPELEAQAGTVALLLSNPTPLPHNVAIEGPGGVSEEGPVVQTDGESEVEAELEPGEYTFYCSVTGHREAGMEGTLTVTE